MAYGIIKKSVITETAHIVRDAVSERCKYSMHGHSYKWIFSLEGPISNNGMVIDFIELKPVKDFIDQFDHATVFWKEEDPKIIDFFKDNFERVLVMNKNCTAENMARLLHQFIFNWTSEIFSNSIYVKEVEVYETLTGSAISRESSIDDILI